MTSSDAAEAATATAVPDPPVTGVPPVDAVLAQLDGLEERAVADRVAAFERAHLQLRRALDQGPDEAPDRAADGTSAATPADPA